MYTPRTGTRNGSQEGDPQEITAEFSRYPRAVNVIKFLTPEVNQSPAGGGWEGASERMWTQLFLWQALHAKLIPYPVDDAAV